MNQRIEIVGKKIWPDWVARGFHGVGPAQPLAAALLRYLHDLHIGITPELAAGFARVLTSDSRHERADRRRTGGRYAFSDAPWAVVLERLAAEFDPEDEEGAAGTRRYTGIVPGGAPFYCAARLAAPLVARACAAVGTTCLFSDDEDAVPSARFDYERYAERLARRLQQVARSEAFSPLFWTDRAFTLSELSRGEAQHARGPHGLPAVDPLALAPLLRLEPHTRRRLPKSRSLPRRLTSAPQFRPLMNRNIGGVDGIHQTRRQADLSGILQSEFLNPPELLLDRLTQSGFLALRRPPLREKQRDVLLVGLLPAAAETPEHHLAEAFWFEGALRLSLWLQKAGLRRSEFLWIAPDAVGRPRDSRYLLARLPAGLPVPETPTTTYRREFLAALGWLPTYLDRHRDGRRAEVGSGVEAAVETEQAVDWAAAAWRGQLDAAHWQAGSEGPVRAEAQLDREAYDTVHVMLFLPRRLAAGLHLGTLRHRLELPLQPGFSLGVTWFPEAPHAADPLDPDHGWALSLGGGHPRPLRLAEQTNSQTTEEPAAFENLLAGAFLDRWLPALLQELSRDR